MKINKIRIQNFKVFEDVTLNFNSSDIIVFDGPNGFGKTTIYDAIELVFTGRIRRYEDLKAKLIDGRQIFSENPFQHSNGIGKDISVTIELFKNGQIYILERFADATQIKPYIDFSVYELFTKDDFLSENRTSVDDENLFLTDLLGKNYNSNFQFLNYVEQEECLFLLKHSDKMRKNHIGHLFDLKEFEQKIKRIDDLKRRFDTINTDENENFKILDQEINQLKANIIADETPTSFVKLLEKKDLFWDQEEINLSTYNYLEIISTDGILDRLKVFIERKSLFSQHRKNRIVDYLLENENLVNDFFKFHNFLSKKDEVRELRTKVTALQNTIKQLEALSHNTVEESIDLNPYDFIPSDLKATFSSTKQILTSSHNELSGLDRIYSDISESRNDLRDELTDLREAGVSSGECILCGYDWKNIETLLLQIETKSEKIKKINSDKSNRLQEAFAEFKSETIKQIIELINKFLTSLNYNKEFVSQLLELEDNHFNDLIKALNFLGIDYSQYLNDQQILDIANKLELLKTEISAIKDTINTELVESYFSEYFREYFNNEFDQVDSVTIEQIEAKKKHLSHKLSLSQNQTLQTKSVQLLGITKKRESSKEISKKLDNLKKTYNLSLKSYQKKIIKDIETVFHIYSGRIMQSFQGGIGLFIFSEKEGIRFQTGSHKTYDAVFTMSSGQLSALIISFTLALHKKYSQNKLILIDDPVQTMDELNLYGFIDLLRNEFYDNQIIMSTHEDMMSAFMRYKFKNYNLSEKRINLKEIAIE
ncbi:AAA family ATPase [Flavobacterium xanthum]|uniref:DNA repair exonuclease SbcCD ATPase subunit n=1 Tax=Flavobacterium xanthum TaxID=69322 RepID=A0A1M7K4F8_9FLAO|nr:AAA family ATPase [Flavobacterium xanthum]SHM60085.1 DNA repair exonuclease SbcCD ATPase subunit [Flavobacterium xanthum]